MTLQSIGEEIKGRNHLDKPYVAKKTILHAVFQKNEVILALQAKILDMAKIEARLQITMNALQKEAGASKYRAYEAVVVPIIVQGKTRSAISESKRVLGDLTKTAKALPRTIRISSRQVQHNVDNDDRGG